MVAGAAINKLDFGVASMKLDICDHIPGHEKSSFISTDKTAPGRRCETQKSAHKKESRD